MWVFCQDRSEPPSGSPLHSDPVRGRYHHASVGGTNVLEEAAVLSGAGSARHHRGNWNGSVYWQHPRKSNDSWLLIQTDGCGPVQTEHPPALPRGGVLRWNGKQTCSGRSPRWGFWGRPCSPCPQVRLRPSPFRLAVRSCEPLTVTFLLDLGTSPRAMSTDLSSVHVGQKPCLACALRDGRAVPGESVGEQAPPPAARTFPEMCVSPIDHCVSCPPGCRALACQVDPCGMGSAFESRSLARTCLLPTGPL